MILGISNDAPAKNKTFHEKFSFNFDLLSDEGNTTGVAYGAAEDTSAKSLRRISYLIGPDGKIVKAYDPVKPDDNPIEMLEALG